MIYNDWHRFEKRVEELLKETSFPENRILANYYENPHFGLVVKNVILSLNGKRELVVELHSWSKTYSLETFNKQGLVHYPPALKKRLIELGNNDTELLFRQLKNIENKCTWEKEGITLDGINRVLEIFNNDRSMRIIWNINSNNEELNLFANLMDKIK